METVGTVGTVEGEEGFGAAEALEAAASAGVAEDGARADGDLGEFSSLAEVAGALEALLFVSDRPVRTALLAEMAGVGEDTALTALEALALRRRSEGVVLREVAGGWRLFTNSLYHHLVERYVVSWDTRKLSQAALETLSVVAYLQPVTRAQVASVRGVNSDSAIGSLVEKGLLREAGTADAPGSPALYATTKAFLERFGLKSAADLPPLELYAPDEETRRLIAERLGAAGASRAPAGAPNAAGAPEAADATDPFAGLTFVEEDEGFEVQLDGVSGRLVAEALAAGFGLTEKVSGEGAAFLREVFGGPDGSEGPGEADGRGE